MSSENLEQPPTRRPLEPLVSPIIPFYDRDGITIYCADCRQVLPFLDRFDLLLTDPPYGIGVGTMQMQAGAKRRVFDSFSWDDRTPSQWVIDSSIEAASDAIIWGGNYFIVRPSRCWLTWDKVQEFSGSDFEAAWTSLDKPCKTFRMSRVEAHTNGKVHPTQKPLALMKWCIGLVPEAKSVLDPFMGSGTTLVAAKQRGLRAVGIEINREYCEAAVERLRQGVLEFEG